MKSRTKLIAGILAAVFVVILGVTITLVVVGIMSGGQESVVRSETDLRTAVAEESDKIIVLADDITVSGDLKMTNLRDLDLNGFSLTVPGTFGISTAAAGEMWFGNDGNGSSTGGMLTAGKIAVAAPNAHVVWNGDVKLTGSGAEAFVVSTSDSTFVMNGKILGSDAQPAAAPELTVKGGSLKLAADASAVTYTVHVDAENPRIENATANANVVVSTARSVTVGGAVTVESTAEAADPVVVTAAASSSVTVKGAVSEVKASGASVVIDTSALVGAVEAATVVNNGRAGEVSATGKVENKPGGTIGSVNEAGEVVNEGIVTAGIKSSGKVENKENATIGGDVTAGGSVTNAGEVTGSVDAGGKVENNGAVGGNVNAGDEISGEGTVGGDVTIDEKTAVKVPAVGDTEFVYDGSAQGIELAAGEGYVIGGDALKNTDAGEYTVTLSLKDNYVWMSGSGDDVAITYTITKAEVAKPSADVTGFVYDGKEHNITVAENALYTVESAAKTNAGEYKAVVSLTDKKNYKWKDGDSEDFEIAWTISQVANGWTAEYSAEDYTYGETPRVTAAVAKFGDVTVKYYSDAACTQEVAGMTGFGPATAAGVYYIKVTVAGTADYTGLSATYTVTVAKAKVERPNISVTSLAYNGGEQSVFDAPADAAYSVSGNTATAVNGYTVTFTLPDTANYEWTGGGNAPIEIDWQIVRGTATVGSEAQLNAAIADDGYAVIKLANDITVTKTVNIKSDARAIDLTLDLGGFTITANVDGNTEKVFLVTSKGAANKLTFTMKNGTVVGGEAWYGLVIGADKDGMLDVTLDNVEISGHDGGLGSNGNDSGGMLRATNSKFNGDFVDSDIRGMGAYLPGNHTYLFNGCTFTGYDGVYAKSGKHAYNDCTFVSKGAAYIEPDYSGSGGDPVGNAMSLDSSKGYQSPLTVEINGGRFESQAGYGIMEYATGDVAAYAEVRLAGVVAFNGARGGVLSKHDLVKAEAGANAELTNFVHAGVGRIELTGDFAADVTVAEGKTITLDLNGHSLQGKIVNNGKLTVSDATGIGSVVSATDHAVYNNGELTVNGGIFDTQMHGKAALYNAGGATANIEGGIFVRSAEAGTPSGNGGNSWYVVYNAGTFNMTGGRIASTSGYSSAFVNVGKANAKAVADFSDNAYVCGQRIAVKNDDFGEMTITGGKFEIIADAANNATGSEALLNAATCNIAGGRFINNAAEGSGAQVVYNLGYAHDGLANEAVLTINGGSFTAIAADARMFYQASSAGNADWVAKPVATVTGGEFSRGGKVVTLNELDLLTYGVAKTQAEFGKMLAVGIDKITLGADIAVGDTMIARTVTLDMNGHTLTVNGKSSGSAGALTVAADAALTVRNAQGREKGGLVVKNDGTGSTNAVYVKGGLLLAKVNVEIDTKSSRGICFYDFDNADNYDYTSSFFEADVIVTTEEAGSLSAIYVNKAPTKTLTVSYSTVTAIPAAGKAATVIGVNANAHIKVGESTLRIASATATGGDMRGIDITSSAAELNFFMSTLEMETTTNKSLIGIRSSSSSRITMTKLTMKLAAGASSYTLTPYSLTNGGDVAITDNVVDIRTESNVTMFAGLADKNYEITNNMITADVGGEAARNVILFDKGMTGANGTFTGNTVVVTNATAGYVALTNVGLSNTDSTVTAAMTADNTITANTEIVPAANARVGYELDGVTYYYGNADNAIASVEGKTVTLRLLAGLTGLGDVTLTAGNITLDLNGHTLKNNASHRYGFNFRGTGDLVFTLTDTAGRGSVTAQLAGDGTGGYALGVNGTGGTLNVENIDFGGVAGGMVSNGTTAGVTVNVDNCTFTQTGDTAGAGAYLAGDHTVNFAASAFTGATGVYIKSGTYSFDGCAISSAEGTAYSAPAFNGSGYTASGSGLVIDSSAGGYAGKINVTATGCTLRGGADGYGFEVVRTAASDAEKVDRLGKVELKGCEFGGYSVDSALAGKVTAYVGTEAQLRGAANGGGINTVLTGDITLTGEQLRFDVQSDGMTLDLAGYTLDGAIEGSRLILLAGGTLNIENGTLDATGIFVQQGSNDAAGTGCYNAIRIKEGNLYLKDLTIKNYRPWGLAVKAVGGYTRLDNVDVISSYGGGIEAAGGKVDVYGGNFTQTGKNDWCSCNVSVSGGGLVNVYGGTFTGDSFGLYVFSSGGRINVYDGTFSAPTALRADWDKNSYPDGKISLGLYGGAFDGDVVIDPSSNVEIGSADALRLLSAATNAMDAVYAGNITLTKDVDLAGAAFAPIAKTCGFAGTFDGRGHTISKMTVVETDGYAGLFGKIVGGGKVVSVKFANAAVGGTEYVGVVAGAAVGDFADITVTNATLTGSHYLGGIAGYAYGNFTNCAVGGLTATAVPDNTAAAGAAAAYDNGDKVGGIVGYLGENNFEVSGCTVDGATLTGYRDIGGIVGAKTGGGANYTFIFTGNAVRNTYIVADQVTNHYGDKEANANLLVGRFASDPLVWFNYIYGAEQNNTRGEVCTLDFAVKGGVALQNALDSALAGTTVTLAGGTYSTAGFAGNEYDDRHNAFTIGQSVHASESVYNANSYQSAYRAVDDLTVKAADGETVIFGNDLAMKAGHIYGYTDSGVTHTVYNPITGTTATSTSAPAYYSHIAVDGLTVEGITFADSGIYFHTSMATDDRDVWQGISVAGCGFGYSGELTAADNDKQGAHIYSETDLTQSGVTILRDITVDKCTFANVFQGVYTTNADGVAFTNNSVNGTVHNALAVQSGSHKDKDGNVIPEYARGNVTVSGNTFENVGDRVIRFNNTKDMTVSITGNKLVNCGDGEGQLLKATSSITSVFSASGNTYAAAAGETASALQEQDNVEMTDGFVWQRAL